MGDTWLSIPELAKSMGTTKQTVYARIDKAKLDLAKLESRTENRVKLYSPEAIETIKRLFDNGDQSKEPSVKKTVKVKRHVVKKRPDLTEEVESLKAQVKMLSDQYEAEKVRVQDLTDKLAEIVARDQTLILNEQMRVAELTAELKRINDQRLLTEAAPSSNPAAKGWATVKRFFAKLTTRADETKDETNGNE